MRTIQIQLIDRKTNQVKGWLVGKTSNKELVFKMGVKTFTIPINSETEAKYQLIKMEVGNK